MTRGKAISVNRIGIGKTLETYPDHYIIEQRGWRVKFSGARSVTSDLLARQLATEMDIQEIRHLAMLCGSHKDDDLPEVDITRLRRAKPFTYTITKEDHGSN